VRADDEVAYPVWRARIADPKPAACSGCLRGADGETAFIDLGMPGDRGWLRDPDSLGVIADLTRLCLCEGCVREAAECLAFEPTLHRRHLAKIREVMADRDRLEEENRHLRALVAEGLVAN
jgi:hypothetical protein